MIKFLDIKKITDSFEPELNEAVTRVVKSGWYLLGEECRNFENAYAGYLGTKHVIGCANGMQALSLIIKGYKQLGVFHDGDEIIVPGNTYIASILAITENNLVPVLADADSESLQINPELIEHCVSSRTKGLMIVHLYGKCAYTQKIKYLCERYGLKLIEDNAQAHGCMFAESRTGSLGDAAGHSFYPGKNLGALGDGGAVTTDDDELATVVRALANYGSEKKYIFNYAGVNSRLDEIQAAVLSLKLKRLDQDNEKRRVIARRYCDEINNLHLHIPEELRHADDSNVYHIFPVLCDERDRLQNWLTEKQIETLIHYPVPPHRQKCFAGKGALRIPAPLPVTETIHAQELSLPISPVLTDEEVSQIINIINSYS